MHRILLVSAAIALVLRGQQDWTAEPPPDGLKEEHITVEYTATSGEAAVAVEAESEAPLGRVEVRGPAGEPLLAVQAPGGAALALSGFRVESREGTLDDLRAAWLEGVHDLRARTVDGRTLRGSAALSFDLPAAPVLVHPVAGAKSVPVDLEVQWLADPGVRAWRVVAEQGENDGLTVQLPAGTHSFRIPAGVLRPGTETQVEVAAVGENGNSTVVECVFTTD